MKKITYSLFFAFIAISLFSQSDLDKSILEAQGYIKEKNYKDAQIALQQAIGYLYELMGKDLIAALPLTLNDMTANTTEDVNNTTAMAMMGGGFNISRNYKTAANDGTSIELNIAANSPLLSSITMMINNPMMLGSSSDAGKSTKIGNRRSLIKSKPADKTYELMIPLVNSLITINGNNIKDEASFLAYVNKLEIEKIARVLGE
jgi:hypothetical protein